MLITGNYSDRCTSRWGYCFSGCLHEAELPHPARCATLSRGARVFGFPLPSGEGLRVREKPTVTRLSLCSLCPLCLCVGFKV